MRYKQVALPVTLFARFDDIRRYFGYRSFSEFVNEMVREGVSKLETKHQLAEFEGKRKDEHEL